jgi:hypothetical protein
MPILTGTPTNTVGKNSCNTVTIAAGKGMTGQTAATKDNAWSTLAADIQFAQAPGKTTSMNIVSFLAEGAAGADPADKTNYNRYEFRLMEYGRLTGAKETATLVKNIAVTTGSKNNVYNACNNMGNQFRPLKEVDKYGRANPFQDPARGVIPKISAGTVALPAITANTKSRNLLINLSGKDSIIGRGISVFNAT